MSTAETVPVFRGRWGYYPTDYATFAAYKQLHKRALRDRRATRRWERWNAKLPHNRVRKLPDGTTAPMPEPVCLGTTQREYEQILCDYRSLRYPKATEAEVSPFEPCFRRWRERLKNLEVFQD